jgi:hypothetical protein
MREHYSYPDSMLRQLVRQSKVLPYRQKESTRLIQTDRHAPLSETRQDYREEFHIAGEQLAATVEQLLHEGNIHRIIVKRERQTILEIPLTIGLVGVVIAPVLAAVGAIGALVTHCTIEVVRVESEGS